MSFPKNIKAALSSIFIFIAVSNMYREKKCRKKTDHKINKYDFPAADFDENLNLIKVHLTVEKKTLDVAKRPLD